MDEYVNLTLTPVEEQNNMDEVEMFRIQPPEKIPRKVENKIIKRSVKIERNWRPGPQPTKPDNECTTEELNRRERRRASNRKAAQSARDRRVKKQESLENKIAQLTQDKADFDEQRKKWDEKESCYIAEMEQKDGIISVQKSQIEALEYQLNNQKHSIPESMQSPCSLSTTDGQTQIAPMEWAHIEEILGLNEIEDKKEETTCINNLNLL